MSERRFHDGDRFEHAGIEFRVRPGRKRPLSGDGQDLVLEWLTSTGWQPTTMVSAGLQVDFYSENEDVLYPPPLYKGGQMCMDALEQARCDGYDTVEWSGPGTSLAESRRRSAEIMNEWDPS